MPRPHGGIGRPAPTEADVLACANELGIDGADPRAARHAAHVRDLLADPVVSRHLESRSGPFEDSRQRFAEGARLLASAPLTSDGVVRLGPRALERLRRVIDSATARMAPADCAHWVRGEQPRTPGALLAWLDEATLSDFLDLSRETLRSALSGWPPRRDPTPLEDRIVAQAVFRALVARNGSESDALRTLTALRHPRGTSDEELVTAFREFVDAIDRVEPGARGLVLRTWAASLAR